jgi:protocatechuate 3,4-dioxygenase beta subunit
MQRKEFLKKLGLSTFVLPFLANCEESENVLGNCTLTDDATAGPFPTKDPASLEIQDIRSDRQGVSLLIEIFVHQKNSNCDPLPDAIVDIWHCDKDGNYSEYGGTGSQGTNYTAVHFLRGRQTTNPDGEVSFQSIYPGWYPGRAPHIHVHVYDATGTTLLVTQIALPDQISRDVYTGSSLYSSRGIFDTSIREDSIFSGSLDTMSPREVLGTVPQGYTLRHAIIVSE